jgi:clorobiocin biosynthesis protein CloN7
MLIGLPGDSVGFASIAPLLASDYTVVTYDPRGLSRSTIEDSSQDASPGLIADDVHRLLTVVSTKPAHVFGSSGGAITGLALATAHPGQIRTLVAHEPPLAELLPDREQMLAAIDEVYDAYRTQGPAAAWPKFFAATGINPPAAADGAGDEPRPQ